MAVPPAKSRQQRPAPQIAANDLARYMVAAETGKLGIIKRSKEIGTATAIRYSDVRRVIRANLADPYRADQPLLSARASFDQRSNDTSLTEFAREDARLSMDVIDAFRRMRQQLGVIDFRFPPHDQTPLMISGVEVPVNLDALVVRPPSDVELIGGALLRFTKADDETEHAARQRREMGTYAATLVLLHVQKNIVGNRKPDFRICLSIDVQCQEIHAAPRTFVQRMRNLESACRFIAAMWDSV
jgi:hypothetical protein